MKQIQANLDQAKQVLKAKSNALDTANAELAVSKHVLMIREIVLKNAKAALATAKKDLATKLATIKQAEGELELAKAALSKQQQKLATAQSAYKIAQANLTKARELAKRFLTKHQNTLKASRDETSVVLHHGKSASNTVVSVPLVKSDKTQSGQMATLKSTAVDNHEAHAMAMRVGGNFNQKNYVKLSSPKEPTSAMGNGVTELPQTDENTDNALMGLGLLGAVCATMFLIPRRKLTIR